MKMRYFPLVLLYALAVTTTLFAETNSIVIETVVASVNDKPITLQDVQKRMNLDRPLSTSDFATNPKSRQALEEIIRERLVEEEATNRKIRVSDAEVTSYLDEVAKRNNLTREEFLTALKNEKRDIEEYKTQIKAEILRSRLLSQVAQSSSGVSDTEVKEYIEQHPALTKAGNKIKLRQILISNNGRSDTELQEKTTEAIAKIDKGEPFAKVAAEYSDAPDGKDGGLLGVLTQEDLSAEIFDAVLPLKDGEHSKAIITSLGSRIFFVEKRYEDKKELDAQLYDEVRKQIEEQKVQERMQNYFTVELAKQHAVDRKI